MNAVLADGVYVDRSNLADMVALVRLAAFPRPEFYRAQAMRLSTYGKPRIVSCAELRRMHPRLPRGCLDEAINLLQSNGVKVSRTVASPVLALDLRFLGTSDRISSARSMQSSSVTSASWLRRLHLARRWLRPRRWPHRGRSTLQSWSTDELLEQWVGGSNLPVGRG